MWLPRRTLSNSSSARASSTVDSWYAGSGDRARSSGRSFSPSTSTGARVSASASSNGRPAFIASSARSHRNPARDSNFAGHTKKVNSTWGKARARLRMYAAESA